MWLILVSESVMPTPMQTSAAHLDDAKTSFTAGQYTEAKKHILLATLELAKIPESESADVI